MSRNCENRRPSGARWSHLPLRAATGAFILNSGIGKLGLDAEHAAGLQGMAASAIPLVAVVPPSVFGKVLGGIEVALGAALLAPFVPPAVAGAGLTAFSGGLLTMYVRMPGVHEEGSLRPTQTGVALAKDVWMLGVGLSLVIDGVGCRGKS